MCSPRAWTGLRRRGSAAAGHPVLHEVAQLHAIPHAELSVRVVGVLLDGLGRNEKPLADLFVAESLQKELDDVCLARREAERDQVRLQVRRKGFGGPGERAPR